MLEPYDGQLSRTVLREESGSNPTDLLDYYPLVNRLGGTVIKVSPTSNHYINPLDIVLIEGDEENPVVLKADFLLSLCDLILGGKDGLQPIEKTVIDRCVHLVYRDYLKNPLPENMPIFEDLWELLKAQPEKEAHNLATALELYVKGSLNVFNHHTNVNLDNRVICFDIKKLGKELKKIGVLIVQDAVWNRVTYNRSIGKHTSYYLDEVHLLLTDEQTAGYFAEMYARMRKYGYLMTLITQNIKTFTMSIQIQNILDNSAFIILLNQASGDRVILQDLLQIPDLQMAYINNSEMGHTLKGTVA